MVLAVVLILIAGVVLFKFVTSNGREYLGEDSAQFAMGAPITSNAS